MKHKPYMLSLSLALKVNNQGQIRPIEADNKYVNFWSAVSNCCTDIHIETHRKMMPETIHCFNGMHGNNIHICMLLSDHNFWVSDSPCHVITQNIITWVKIYSLCHWRRQSLWLSAMIIPQEIIFSLYVYESTFTYHLSLQIHFLPQL